MSDWEPASKDGVRNIVSDAPGTPYWATPGYLFPNAASGDFSPPPTTAMGIPSPTGGAAPASPADLSRLYGHYTDPVVPGVDQTKMVFGPTGPLAPALQPLPDVQVPPAPQSPPSKGAVKVIKDVAGGTQRTGTDYSVGAAPAGSTSDKHDDPLTRDRTTQKDADAAAAAAAGVTWPTPLF